MSRTARRASLNPKSRQFALNILDLYHTNSHHYLDECWAIGDFVKKKVKYVRDPATSELLQCPLMMMDRINEQGFCHGDCDDMALLIATLIIAVGGEPVFRAVRYKDEYDHYNHIYVVVIDNNINDNGYQRLAIDAIMKDKPIGYEVPHSSGDDFKIVK